MKFFFKNVFGSILNLFIQYFFNIGERGKWLLLFESSVHIFKNIYIVFVSFLLFAKFNAVFLVSCRIVLRQGPESTS